MRETTTTKETREDALRRRLIPYWKMEAWSAVLIPALVIWSAPPHTAAETAAAIFSLLAVSLQLIVGARYWFVVVKRMLGNQSSVASLMRILDRVQLSDRLSRRHFLDSDGARLGGCRLVGCSRCGHDLFRSRNAGIC